MLDLLTTLYDIDAIRFPLWDGLHTIGLDGLVLWALDMAGYTVFEDWSMTK